MSTAKAIMHREFDDVLYSVSPTTLPNSVCFPCSSSARSGVEPRSSVPPHSRRQRGHVPSVIKNWDSFEFLVPLFAITTSPRCANRSRGCTSSSNGSADNKWGQATHVCVRDPRHTRPCTKTRNTYHHRTTLRLHPYQFYLQFARGSQEQRCACASKGKKGIGTRGVTVKRPEGPTDEK